GHAPRPGACPDARRRLSLVAGGTAARRHGDARAPRARNVREGPSRSRPLRRDGRPVSRLAAGAAQARRALHPCRDRRVRGAGPRLVRGRVGWLGGHLRPPARGRALRPQSRRRPRERRPVLPPPLVLSPLLLPAAPSGDRVALDATGGAGPLAALAPGTLSRSPGAVPAVLDAGADTRLHTRGVEAALLSSSVAPSARAPHSAAARAPPH